METKSNAVRFDAVSPDPAQSTPTTATTATLTLTKNRLPLFALLPPALIAVACVGAVTQRAIASRVSHGTIVTAGDKAPFGNLSANDARRLADGICTKITGKPADSLDASRQTAYSQRRGTVVREWNVLCNTPDAVYLVRINANTGKVYAINEMEQGGLDDAVALARLQGNAADHDSPALSEEVDACHSDSDATRVGRLGRPAAEAQARRYLSAAGVSFHGLHSISESASCNSDQKTQWNFTYRRNVPGMGNRLVKISVDGSNGRLTHMWNPVSAM